LQGLWSYYTNPENYKKMSKAFIPQINGDFDPDGTADDHSLAATAANADIEYSRAHPTINPLLDSEPGTVDAEAGISLNSRRKQSLRDTDIDVGVTAGDSGKRRSSSGDTHTFY
jgi:hypothetical protein